VVRKPNGLETVDGADEKSSADPVTLPTTLLTKARENGLEESLRLGRDAVHATIRRFSGNGENVSIFLSPPMSNSGAPQILMDVVEEFATRPGSVRLLSPFIAPEMRQRAHMCGVRVERAAGVMGPTLVGLQLALRKDDFVLMNTVGVLRNYQEFILESLRIGKLGHAYWYIHEDVDQLPAVAPFLLEPGFRSLIRRLVEEERLTLLVPSRKVKTQYNTLFSTDKTQLLPFKVVVNPRYTTVRPATDYASVRFLLAGRPTDGRKGHMIALAAFHEFLRTYYDRQPAAYRPFTVTFVGMTQDFIGQQIASIGLAVLGERLRTVPGVSHEKALDITRACNAVICCSLNEALPLYVIEGMSMGHIVLRNDAGGMEEQLAEGVNGFRIDSHDIRQIAGVLEVVLNRQATPDVRLQAMGNASQEMIAALRIASYVQSLERAG
jgi:glycosyltransferase involved in cell wall biosynthesis